MYKILLIYNMNNYKVGICGIGFVGNAIMQYLKKFKYISLVVYDKYKEINDFKILLDTDPLYICLPTNYNAQIKTYYMKEINDTIAALSICQYKGVILIKSTVLPDYCMNMNNLYPDLIIVHNPEFLSAKSAVIDFAQQSHIVLGFTKQSLSAAKYIKKFYTQLFPQAEISDTISECSALMKLVCNSFYATKIQFFTEIYLLCERLNISYDEVKQLMLKNNWINPHHTEVPGSDNFISFGGACLPKDMAALNAFMQQIATPNAVINATIVERNDMRKD